MTRRSFPSSTAVPSRPTDSGWRGVARGLGAGGRAFSRGEPHEGPREPRVVDGTRDGPEHPGRERRKGALRRGRPGPIPGLRRSFRLPDDHSDLPQSRQLGADRGPEVGRPEPGDRGPGRRIGGQDEGASGQPSGPHVGNGLLAENAMNRAFHPYQDASFRGERAGRSCPPENRADSPGLGGLIRHRRFPHGGEAVSLAAGKIGGG